MRTRHRQPTLVSMWMLDVFCCALGCVIMLLLLKMRESGIIIDESTQLSTNLDAAQHTITDLEAKSTALGSEVSDRDGKLALLLKEADTTAKKLALVEKERDDNARQLALVRTERDALAKNLAVAQNAVKTTEAELLLSRKKADAQAKLIALSEKRNARDEDRLAKNNSEIAELAKKLADAQKAAADLQVLIREKEKLRADAMRQAVELNDRLIALEAKLRNSTKQIDDLTAKSTDSTAMRDRIRQLEKQLTDSNVTIVDLQGTKAKLADKINKLQIESEQRFAGIAMTGKNVVFLVDMSGSMGLTDEKTPNPEKWPIVRDTLAKVMRSLPDLDRFQVVIFSSKADYLIGSSGQWINYQKEKSIEDVRKALTAVKPVGDTNMYLALDEAFKYRARGLDTIYLLSDGLPTSGPGLSLTEEKTLGESERGVILARHLRQILKTNWNRPIGNQRVRINSIGFFYESPDVGAFLWALSRENDGSFVGMSRP